MKRIRNYIAAIVIGMMAFSYVPANINVYAEETQNDWSFLTEAHNIVAEQRSSALNLTWDGPSGVNVMNTVYCTNKTTGEVTVAYTSDTSAVVEGLDYETRYDVHIDTRDHNKNTLKSSDTYTFQTSSPDFLIITDESLFGQGDESFRAALKDYIIDANRAGANPGVYKVSASKEGDGVIKCDTKEKLKAFITSKYNRGAKGFVLIGSSPNIPTAYWRYCIADDEEAYPSDLYYADMRGQEWVDVNNDGVFESYASKDKADGSVKYIPELYYGRINPNGYVTGQTNVRDEVTKYLTKIHKFKNNINLTEEEEAMKNKALVFNDCTDFRRDKKPLYHINDRFSDIKGVFDENETCIDNLKTELQSGYGFIHLLAHSHPQMHQLETNDTTEDNNERHNFYYDENSREYEDWGDGEGGYIKDLNVKGYYMNAGGCSSCRYEDKNQGIIPNLGAFYLFGNDYMINVAGDTGDWGLWYDQDYYDDLFGTSMAGNAFKGYLERYNDDGNPKAVLLGDPTMKYGEFFNKPSKATPYISTNTAGKNNEANVTVEAGKSNIVASANKYPVSISITSPDIPANELSCNSLKAYWRPTEEERGTTKHCIVTVSLKDSEGNVTNKYTETFRVTVK